MGLRSLLKGPTAVQILLWPHQSGHTLWPHLLCNTQRLQQNVIGGRCGSGGKSCRLAVGGLLVQSHPGRVEVSLSKTPNPQLLLTSWLVPCMAANRHWCVNVCVNGWMRGINCTALWIKALYKCCPFTIYSINPAQLIGLHESCLQLMFEQCRDSQYAVTVFPQCLPHCPNWHFLHCTLSACQAESSARTMFVVLCYVRIYSTLYRFYGKHIYKEWMPLPQTWIYLVIQVFMLIVSPDFACDVQYRNFAIILQTLQLFVKGHSKIIIQFRLPQDTPDSFWLHENMLTFSLKVTS